MTPLKNSPLSPLYGSSSLPLATESEVTAEKIESMMVETRIRLLKLPEVSNLRVGKRIEVLQNPFAVFYAFDVESMEKLRFVQDSAIYIQFQRQVAEPFVVESDSMNYEMEPGKDITYS